MSTAQTVITYAKAELSQTTKAVASGMPSGLSEDDFRLTTDQHYLTLVNEAQNRLAKLCVPILDTTSFTMASGQIFQGYSTLTSSASRILHRPYTVAINGGNVLPQSGIGWTYGQPVSWYPADGSNDPTAWIYMPTGIGLPVSSATPTINIVGFFLPQPLTTPGQSLDAIFDDYCVRTMAFYVAWMVAAKLVENNVLQLRLTHYGTEFTNGVRELYDRLVLSDETVAPYFVPQPIDAMVQLVKQQQVKN